MSTDARRSSIPPRPTEPPEAQPQPGVPQPRSRITDALLPPEPPAPPRPAAPPPSPTAPPAAPTSAETTTQLRVPPPPPAPEHPPGVAARHGSPFSRAPWAVPPETPAELTTRLRPVPARRPVRTIAAVACVVLGLGLIGGAVTGSWLTGDSAAEPAARSSFSAARALWHSTPVDTLFPRTLQGTGAGPGGADRTWTRIAVAPDGPCANALDPLLVSTLNPVGCERVLRATYTDATASSVTTVGLIFTAADAPAARDLRARFDKEGLAERADLMPRPFAAAGTTASAFGDRQRGSWTVRVLTDAPVVVFAVSGFADGRQVARPLPADKAMAARATSDVAQAGLGQEAKGIADRIERGLRKTVEAGQGTDE